MFLLDQLFCDRGKLRYNELSLVGQNVITYLFAWIAEKIMNQSKNMLSSTQDSMHKIYTVCCHKIAVQVETFLS